MKQKKFIFLLLVICWVLFTAVAVDIYLTVKFYYVNLIIYAIETLILMFVCLIMFLSECKDRKTIYKLDKKKKVLNICSIIVDFFLFLCFFVDLMCMFSGSIITITDAIVNKIILIAMIILFGYAIFQTSREG